MSENTIKLKTNVSDSLTDDEKYNVKASEAVSAIGKAMYELVTNTDITKNLSDIVHSFSDRIRDSLSNIFPKGYFTSIHQKLLDAIIAECETAGSMGWCIHNIDGVCDELSATFFREEKCCIDDGDTSIAEIDFYIAKQFSKETVDGIVLKTDILLSPEDSNKLHKAMINYRARRYYDAANLLAGLIDAQSIKEIILHDDSKRYIQQGLPAFTTAYNMRFSEKLDTSSIKCSGKDREEKLAEFIKANKFKNNETDKLIRQHVSLMYAVFAFFHNSNWIGYPANKPAVINRHWLAHGMYDYDDIKRSDCLKLLLILNQVASLYQ